MVTKSAAETSALGKNLARLVKQRKGRVAMVFCFYGELGSGKTTSIQGLAKGLGVSSRLLSPTFIIVRRYLFDQRIFYHIDLYRTNATSDLLGLGLEEMLNDPKAVVAIEWADKLGELLPSQRVDIACMTHVNGSHSFRITEYG